VLKVLSDDVELLPADGNVVAVALGELGIDGVQYLLCECLAHFGPPLVFCFALITLYNNHKCFGVRMAKKYRHLAEEHPRPKGKRQGCQAKVLPARRRIRKEVGGVSLAHASKTKAVAGQLKCYRNDLILSIEDLSIIVL